MKFYKQNFAAVVYDEGKHWTVKTLFKQSQSQRGHLYFVQGEHHVGVPEINNGPQNSSLFK